MFFDKNKGYIKNYKYNKNDLLKEVYPNGNNNKEIYKCNPKYYVNTIKNTSLLYIYIYFDDSINPCDRVDKSISSNSCYQRTLDKYIFLDEQNCIYWIKKE